MVDELADRPADGGLEPVPHPGDETGAALGVEGEAVEAEPGGLVPDRREFGEASAQESMDLCLGESVDGADGVEDEASGKGIDEEDLGLPVGRSTDSVPSVAS